MADEIEIAEYDPRWPERFALEAARIRRVLAQPALEIEHHGSTAVPGLAAKPVIDMLVAVDSMTVAERHAAALIDDGYEAVEPRYREMWPERIVVIRREHGQRVCHVHLMLRGHPIWKRLLAFRDHLRAAPRGRRAIRRAQAVPCRRPRRRPARLHDGQGRFHRPDHRGRDARAGSDAVKILASRG